MNHRLFIKGQVELMTDRSGVDSPQINLQYVISLVLESTTANWHENSTAVRHSHPHGRFDRKKEMKEK